MIELQQINRIKLADKNLLFSRLNKQKTLIKDDFGWRGGCEGHEESGVGNGGSSSGRSDCNGWRQNGRNGWVKMIGEEADYRWSWMAIEDG